MSFQTVGRYQLLDLLGRGAIGEVYRALDPDLNREVAVKLISRPEQRRTEAQSQRFRREVRAAARLNHPHIVTIYDVGLEHEPPYVVMELMAGGTLEAMLKARPNIALPWREVLLLVRPLCQALAHAHDAGIVHRDVKPANVLFTVEPGRSLKLADFGLAQWTDAERLTDSGGVVGTIAYMSPEQANGETVDGRADIFAVGLILVEAITGLNPLRADSLSETMARVVSYEPIDLTHLENHLPARVVEIIRQSLARNRRDRYHQARQLDEAIAQALRQPDPPPKLRAATDRSNSEVSSHLLLQIEKSFDLTLPSEAVEVLEAMFADYGRLAIKQELTGGFSGSRLLLVRPIRPDGTPELPAVIKLAPVHLIQQEWRAYQVYIRSQLAGVAEVQGQPVLPSGNNWGGLRYPLVGGGDFATITLHDYYAHASLKELRYVLEQRLFRRMGPKWRYNFSLAEFRLGDSYDLLLPVNLLLEPAPLTTETTVHLLRPEFADQPLCQSGDSVHVQGFVVTEVDADNQAITLNRPIGHQPRFYPSYRVRLQPVGDVAAYQAGQVVDVAGIVTATRADLLRAQVQALFGSECDGTAVSLTLPNGACLPNPLIRLPELLATSLTVKTANIHGDFNLTNILVDPASRDVSLIDFALARHDHALHDLLRLETEIVTRLLPDALASASLPPSAIYQVYRQLQWAMAHEKGLTVSPHPALEKPLAMLTAVRQTARACLFDPADWTEYYQGLTLYLLSTLKLQNLNVQARQVAFWGAATSQELMTDPDGVLGTAVTLSHPAAKPKRTYQFIAGAAMAFFLLVLFALFFRQQQVQTDPAEPLAILTDFEQSVEVKLKANGRLQPATFALPLYEGDTVITYANAMALILCNNGLLIKMPAENNLVVTCQNKQDPRVLTDITPPLNPVITPLPAQTRESVTVPANQINAPLLLNPRNTWIAVTRPTFSWQSVDGAESYRLTVNLESGEAWQRETTATTLPYPADAPPLRPGSTNEVIVEVVGEANTADKSSLQVLDSASAASLAIAEANIREQEGTTEILALALIYQQSGLFSAAIEQLKMLTTGQRSDSQHVWSQLGDLYSAVGLDALANASYQAALQVEATADAGIAATAVPPSPTPTPTHTPSPTAAPSPVPVVDLPVGVGTAVPQPLAPVSPANAAQVVALAQWQIPWLSEVTCSPDGQTLAVASSKSVPFYSSHNLEEGNSLSVHDAVVNTVTFSADGQFLAAGAADNVTRLWRVVDGQLMESFGEHRDQIWKVAFSPDGQFLASASLDRTVRLWQVESLSLHHTLVGHNGPVRGVAFSPDGQFLASASDDGNVKLWRVSDGALLETIPAHTDKVRSVAFSPDGQRLASASDDGTIRLWRISDGHVAAGTAAQTLVGHIKPVFSVAFSPDGQTLASASADRTIRFWQVADGQWLNTIGPLSDWVYTVEFCADGHLLVSGLSDGVLNLWGARP